MKLPFLIRAGTGLPIVFLHGIGGAARMWQPQIVHFARRGYDAIAFDLPGYGEHHPLASGTSFEALTDGVEQVMQKLGLDRPVLVGHSLGGMIVQTFLRRHPEGAAAAVLSGTSPAFGDPKGEFQKKFLADRLGPLDEGRTMPELADDLVAMLVGPDPDPEGIELARRCMAATSPETYRSMMTGLTRFDERANLADIRVPVLALAGEVDPNAPPRMMEKMAAKIPGARFVALPGAGHLANIEQPDAFNAAVDGFLDEALDATQKKRRRGR